MFKFGNVMLIEGVQEEGGMSSKIVNTQMTERLISLLFNWNRNEECDLGVMYCSKSLCLHT